MSDAVKKITTNFRNGVGSIFSPNFNVSTQWFQSIVITELVLMIVLWLIAPTIFPSPVETYKAMVDLVMEQGLLGEMWISLWTAIQAIAISTGIALFFSYLSVVPVFRMVSVLLAALRAVSIIGVSFFMTLYVGGHWLKVGLLVFSMTPFFMKSMIDVVQQVPVKRLNYVRTMRSSEWRVLYEEQILGTLGAAFDIMKQNGAMGWLMLPMVEGLVRSEGGLGAMLLNQEKHFSFAAIVAIQFVFFGSGMALDWIITLTKTVCAPWSVLDVERKR